MNQAWTKYLPHFLRSKLEGRQDLQNVVINTGWQFEESLVRMGGGVMVGINRVSQYHMDRWGNYRRYTTASIQRLFKSVLGHSVEVRCFKKFLAPTAFLQGLAVEGLADKSLLDKYDPDCQMNVCIVAKKAS